MGASGSVPVHAKTDIDTFDQEKKVVCLVHGFASSQLELSIGKGAHAGDHEKGFHLAFVSADKFTEENRQQTLTALALPDSRKWLNPNKKGVHVRVVSGVDGITCLNPDSDKPVGWQKMVDALRPQFNVLALNYDWRRWGDKSFADAYLDAFRTAIEASVTATYQPVDIVAHSMGASVTQYCLSVLGPAWQKLHVGQCIWVAPCHAGTACALPTFAARPTAGFSDFIPVPEFLQIDTSEATSSWPALAALAPHDVGDVHPYEYDYAFATTPTMRYTTENMTAFFEDLVAKTNGHSNGVTYAEDMKQIWAAMQPLAVPVKLLYSNGTRTTTQYLYKSEDLSVLPEIGETQWGDGVVPASVVEALVHGWRRKNIFSDLQLYMDSKSVLHKDMISSDFACKLVPKILSGTAPPGRSIALAEIRV